MVIGGGVLYCLLISHSVGQHCFPPCRVQLIAALHQAFAWAYMRSCRLDIGYTGEFEFRTSRLQIGVVPVLKPRTATERQGNVVGNMERIRS